MKKMNLLGCVFGRLSVQSKGESDNHKNSRWVCLCTCGKEVLVRGYDLKNGHTTSCGCSVVERITTLGYQQVKHGGHVGGKPSKAYKTWQGIKQRCYNPKANGYQFYGGKGISVCDRWLNSFENFLEDMGNPPSKDLQIDRIKSAGNYEPNNCRWVTGIENLNNRDKYQQKGSPAGVNNGG